MGRKCSICTHPDRGKIDRDLFYQKPLRVVADKYGVNRQAVWMHRNNHLLPLLAKAEAAEEMARAESIWSELRRLKTRMWNLLDRAEKKHEHITAVSAAREIRGCLELCAKLEGQIQENTVINIINLPQWQELQQVLSSTLEAFPEARLAVADRLAHYTGVSSALVHAETPRNGRDKS
jgi:hypothetical protein